VGLEAPDDAGVYRLSDDLALVQSVDLITPIVDDPFTFGRIAAANALSDIWAMGGTPLTALNIICFPENRFPDAILQETLQGGLALLNEAGCTLIGGHSVENDEFTYGLAVTGRVNPQRFLTARGAQPGEKLIVTKALGTGIVALAARGDLAPEEARAAAVSSMTATNRQAGEIMLRHSATACTDITGFGLIGHADEMIGPDPIALHLQAGRVPVLTGTVELTRMGLVPATLYSNRNHYSGRVTIVDEVDPWLADILFDPQTSGGLLFSVPADEAEPCLAALRDAGLESGAIVGEIRARERDETEIIVHP